MSSLRWLVRWLGIYGCGSLFPFLLLDEKEPKNQGRLHRASPRLSKRLTFRSGSDFCKVKRKRPSVKVKRLAIPCGRFPARQPRLPAQPGWVLAFPLVAYGRKPPLQRTTPQPITQFLPQKYGVRLILLSYICFYVYLFVF